MLGFTWKSVQRSALAAAVAWFTLGGSAPVWGASRAGECAGGSLAAVIARSTSGFSSSYCPLPRPIAHADPGGVHVSSGSSRSAAMAPGESQLERPELMTRPSSRVGIPAYRRWFFPDVLGRLNSDVRWTTDLGNAFLAQQADVMNTVQTMRERAQANGRLNSTPQQTVSTRNAKRPVRHRHPAGRSPSDLRAGIRPNVHLGTAGLGRIPAALVSGLWFWLWIRPWNQHRPLLRRLGRLGLGRLGAGDGDPTGSAMACS